MGIVTQNWQSLRSRAPVEISCYNCNKTFTKNKHRVQDTLLQNSGIMFCSISCGIQYHTQYTEGFCDNCSLPIKRCLSDWVKTNHHFCSSRCAALYTNKNSTFTSRGPKPTKPKKIPKNKLTGKYKRTEVKCCECGKTFYGHRERKYCSRKCSGKNSFYPNSTRVHRTEYSGFQLDSGAELYFAKELDARGIQWLKNGGSKLKKFFSYTDKNGKVRKYYPDFYLTSHNVWIEIKGRKYQSENDQIKMASIDTKSYYLISNDFKKNIENFFVDLENYIDGGSTEARTPYSN